MQNYLDLHRHSAVRTKLLNHAGIALRLAVAQIVAGSELWTIHADPQKANTDAIKASLKTNKSQTLFAKEHQIVRELLDIEENDKINTIVKSRAGWGTYHDLPDIFAKLLNLDDETVSRIFTYVVAETLTCSSPMVEILGNILEVDMAESWQVDDTFLELNRDKQAINAMLKHIGGKQVADANISATAKVQKKIIADYLDGTRQPHKKANNKKWQPRYMDFPFTAYTKRGGIDAIENWKAVKKRFA